MQPSILGLKQSKHLFVTQTVILIQLINVRIVLCCSIHVQLWGIIFPFMTKVRVIIVPCAKRDLKERKMSRLVFSFQSLTMIDFPYGHLNVFRAIWSSIRANVRFRVRGVNGLSLAIRIAGFTSGGCIRTSSSWPKSRNLPRSTQVFINRQYVM